MTFDLTVQKRDLRRQIQTQLQALTGEERRQASDAACALLRSQTVWQQAGSILFFAPLPMELDLTPLLREALEAGKTVALPGYVPESESYGAFVIRHLADDCAPGKFGISEPKSGCLRLPPNRLDLVLAPGVAFDVTGHRLGRGRGFYDRLLANATATKCGVAFDSQIVDAIPAEAHDIRMNCLLTPTRWRQMPR